MAAKFSKARQWDAAIGLLLLHTYCAQHCGEWSPVFSLGVFVGIMIPTGIIAIYLLAT